MRTEGMPLLRSKLLVPPLPEALVERPRLRGALAGGAPVTVVSAPAGWGKTVLLSWWLHTGGPAGSAAWLSAEPGDDHRFWAYLRAALEASEVAEPDTVPDEVFLAQLADVLLARPAPAVVVLDDFHHVRDPRVLHGLDFLLRHAPRGLRLVIGTRTEPALPLYRWRLAGELTELRSTELAFTTAETAELLDRHGLALPAARVGEVHTRTEGWPAGVRLAALAAAGPTDALAPADPADLTRAADDYLTGEVLAGQPVEVRDVLRRTAILDRICAGLVDALGERRDGGQILPELARHGLVRPAEDGWYRSHRMFGEVFQAELERDAPAQVAELHRIAAGWFAAHELPVEALRHALAGRDWARATGVFGAYWPVLVQYGHAVGCRDAAAAPTPTADLPVADLRPELAMAYAADLLGVPDVDGARSCLARAGGSVPAIALRLAAAQYAGDRKSLRSAAGSLLGLAGTDDRASAIALGALGVAELDEGRLPAAQRALADGSAAADRAGLACARRASAGRLALVHAVRGELRTAEQAARFALDLPACPGRPPTVHCGSAHLALAIVHLERDRVGDAAAHLDLAAVPGDPALTGWSALVQARLRYAGGDLTGSFDALHQAREGGTAFLAHWAAAVEADLRTAHGDTATARSILEPRRGGPMTAVALARAYLRDDDPQAAARVLPDWAQDDSMPLGTRIAAGLLDAQGAHRTGADRQATRMLERVLQLAEPDGYRRVFTGAGADVRDLLAAHLDSGTAYWPWVSELVAGTSPSAPRGSLPVPGEALTDRELTILRYLQSLLSNGEIASSLCLSVNTVKTHVRNIYRKLDTTRRRDAVRRARELHLL